jgi:hypothetical protein
MTFFVIFACLRGFVKGRRESAHAIAQQDVRPAGARRERRSGDANHLDRQAIAVHLNHHEMVRVGVRE